jgi:nitronate monooxygenase
MWPRTPLTDKLGITYPILLAPMAGGPSTPALVASVSNAGGLGSFGAGYAKPDQIRAAVREIQRLTDRPFSVNLFIPAGQQASPPPEDLSRAEAMIRPYYEELGLAAPPLAELPSLPPFAEQLAAVIEERVPVFSFTSGLLPAEHARELKARGVILAGNATTVREALLVAECGADIVIGQGSEAGGHRGTFATAPERGLIGTMALIPQLADRVGVPVVAAGGIMDGRGIVAALALGAAGVQMGTAFLRCAESGAHPRYKEAVAAGADEDATALTRAFSGRLARSRRNRFVEEIAARGGPPVGYPEQHALTVGLRQAAAARDRPELMSLWSGQGAPRNATGGAAELIAELAAEVERVIERLR